MDTAPPESSQLFFKYLRRAEWHARHQYNPTDRPQHALFEFIVQNQVSIYLGLLGPEHGSMQIGLLPHVSPMNATVFPEDEQRMTAWFAAGGCVLLPSHILGATIDSRRRMCEGNHRVYTQLGTVMVRPNSLTTWSKTNFVFAAEINEDGKAVWLWMFEKSGLPPPNPHVQTLQPYPLFDLRTIANIPADRKHPQVLLEIRCGEAGWRERSKRTEYVGVGLIDLMYHASPKPVHFVRVVQISTGHLQHATLIHRNPTEMAGRESTPIWICAWCEHPQTVYCPHLNGEILC